MIESTICAAAAPGAYHADVPEQLHDLAAALGGALDHGGDLVLGNELADRHSADRRGGDDRDHLVSVAAQHDRAHVLDGCAGLPGDEGLKASGVEDPRLPEDTLLRETRDVLRDMAHRVERIRHHDQDRVGALGDDFLGDVLDDLLVRLDEIVTAHAG